MKLKLLLTMLIGASCCAIHAETIYVSTAEELYEAIRQDSHADIKLTDNIVLTESNWYFDYLQFKGSIDGYYTNNNGQGEFYQIGTGGVDPIDDPIFESMDGAHLSNISFSQCTIEAPGSYYGLLAGTCNSCVFDNIYFFECYMVDDALPGYCASDCGLIAYFADDCTFNQVLCFGCGLDIDGPNVGTIVAKAENSTFNECMVNAACTVYGGGNGFDAYTGGLCGRADHCTFINCVNMATVGTDIKGDRIGGICGSSEYTTFTTCRNLGNVVQTDKDNWKYLKNATKAAAAVAVQVGTQMLLKTYYTVSKVSQINAFFMELDAFEKTGAHVAVQATSGSLKTVLLSSQFFVTSALLVLDILWIIYDAQEADELGGICGYAYAGIFDGCVNSGTCVCRDAYCGGIVGYAEGGNDASTLCEIKQCLNDGPIYANEQSGGIVGYLNHASVYNCLNVGSVHVDKDTRGGIYGDKGSINEMNLYTINSYDDQDVHTLINVSHPTLATGRVAMSLNTNPDKPNIWRQKIGVDIYPSPYSYDGDEGIVTADSIDDEAECFVHVTNADELQNAFKDYYAYIAIDNDIQVPQPQPEDGDDEVDVSDVTYYGFFSELTPFKGVIDGQNHKINGLFLNASSEEQHIESVALISYADGASFKNINMSQCNFWGSHYVGSLVSFSKNSTYENVNLIDHSTIGCWGVNVGGLVAESENDNFLNCSTDNTCNIWGDGWQLSSEANCGGLVGEAFGSVFEGCVNNAEVVAADDCSGGIASKAERSKFILCTNNGFIRHDSYDGFFAIDDRVGGIVAESTGSLFDRCTNNGHVDAGDEYVGGIVGCSYGYEDDDDNITKTQISNCLNTGYVNGDNSVGGIVGYMENTSIKNSLNVGNVVGDSSSDIGKIYGENSGDGTGWTNCYYWNDTYIIGGGGSCGVTSEMLGNGNVALWLNESLEDVDIWRQNITFDPYPVLNTTHDIVKPENCSNVHYISTRDDYYSFVYDVNELGKLFEIGILQSDLDLGLTAGPIGTKTNPFRGIFIGNGHTVTMNLIIDSRGGFFGTLGPGAVVKDLIIAGNIQGTSGGGTYAGIAACAEAPSGYAGKVQILRSGNLANVTGYYNCAGIIGAVYSSDNLELIVTDCYNAGTIVGTNGESATICGSTKKKATITRTWNKGGLYGNDDLMSMVRVPLSYSQTGVKLVDCYNIETAQPQSGANVLTGAQFKNGELCNFLNSACRNSESDEVWQQNLGTDDYPTFGDKRIYSTRTVSSSLGTICMPVDLCSDENVQFYTLKFVNDATDALNFESVDTLKAGTPGLFTASTPGEIEFDGVGNSFLDIAGAFDIDDDWTIKGTYERLQFNTESTSPSLSQLYYVSGGKVKNATRSLTVSPYRIYFVGPEFSSSAVKQFNIYLDGEPTSIETILVDSEDNGNRTVEGIYNLAGQRLNHLQKGLNIINGKKVIIK